MASPYSDTPETDDQLHRRGAGGPPSWHVHETFSRNLERERNAAWHSLARIHSIMTSKEERGEDILLGSTAFKSVTKWASYVPAGLADDELELWKKAAAVIGITSPEELHGYMQAKLETEHHVTDAERAHQNGEHE